MTPTIIAALLLCAFAAGAAAGALTLGVVLVADTLRRARHAAEDRR